MNARRARRASSTSSRRSRFPLAKRATVSGPLAAATVLAVLCFAAVACAAKSSAPKAPPPPAPPQPIRFFTADSVALDGLWYPAGTRAPVLVLAPRRRGVDDELRATATEFQKRGFQALTFQLRDPAPPSRERDPEVDRVYARNLRTLIALSSRFGMTALFVPQVLNEEALARAGDRGGWTPYVTSAALPALIRSFNGVMADVCARGDRTCVFVEEPLRTSWTNDDFVDEGHLSRSGGAKLAGILARRIQALSLARSND